MTLSGSPALPFWSMLCFDGRQPGGVASAKVARAIAGINASRTAGRLAERANPSLRLLAGEAGSDTFRFLKEWLRHPLGTAAIAPSGKALAALITREIDGSSGPVLELGPGTGVFTKALLDRGVAERDLTLVEQNPSFAALLSTRFPTSTILDVDAAELVRAGLPAARRYGAAVCGLGLRSMHPAQVEEIIRGTFVLLTPGASLFLFTYGRRCSVPEELLGRLGLIAERVGSTVRNIPPASVFRVRHQLAAAQ